MPRFQNPSPYTASLDGVSLTGLDSRIDIFDIRETAQEKVTLLPRGRYDGQLPLLKTRRFLEVTLRIRLRAWKPEERRGLFSLLAAWAKSGCLQISTRPARLLYGSFLDPFLPDPGSLSEMTLVFRASDFPYWLDAEPSTHTETGRQILWTFTPEGATDYVFLEALIANQQAAPLTSIQLSTYARDERLSFMLFSGLALNAGETFQIAYDEKHRLHLQSYGEDGAKFRSAASSDHLILFPGEPNTVLVQLNRTSRVQLTARGVRV